MCLTALAKTWAFHSMDSTDSFNKLREQLKVSMSSTAEVRTAIGIISK